MKLLTTVHILVLTNILEAATLVEAVTAGTYSKCYTKFASTSTKSVPTSTKSRTITWPLYQVVTITPVSTVTPSPTTTTLTATEIDTVTATLPQVTDTATSTESDTVTITVTATTSTITETDTATTTITSSGTTTIPTSSGFLPVQTTLPNAKSKRDNNGGLDFSFPMMGQLSRRAASQPMCRKTPLKYPSSVNCNQLIIVYSKITQTKTAKTTSTKTLVPVTTTKAMTQTALTTSTVTLMDASTTVTVTSIETDTTTTTPLTTTTSTTTVTATVAAPSATFYAACAAANIAGTVGSYGINLADGSFGNYVSTSDSTPYDCCVSCINDPNCSDAAFANTAGCSLQEASQCTAPGQYGLTAYVDNNLPPDGFVYISNGNCGAYRSIST